MVAQELQGNDVQNALQAVDSLRDDDEAAVLDCSLVSILLVADDYRAAASSSDLLKSVHNLGKEGIARHYQQDWHAFINEGKRPVLELSGEDAFAVHVRDFLDLQGAFQARGRLVATTHQEQTFFLEEDVARQRKKFLVLLQNLADLIRKAFEGFDDFLSAFAHTYAVFAKLQCH